MIWKRSPPGGYYPTLRSAVTIMLKLACAHWNWNDLQISQIFYFSKQVSERLSKSCKNKWMNLCNNLTLDFNLLLTAGQHKNMSCWLLVVILRRYELSTSNIFTWQVKIKSNYSPVCLKAIQCTFCWATEASAAYSFCWAQSLSGLAVFIYIKQSLSIAWMELWLHSPIHWTKTQPKRCVNSHDHYWKCRKPNSVWHSRNFKSVLTEFPRGMLVLNDMWGLFTNPHYNIHFWNLLGLILAVKVVD